MELTRDIYLRGTAWATAVQSLSDIFRTRTNYSLFMLSLSLGIMYDKRIKDPDMGEVEDHNPPSVPRNVLQNQAIGSIHPEPSCGYRRSDCGCPCPASFHRCGASPSLSGAG